MPAQTFYRCLHCRGFYPTNLSSCQWCSYETRFCDAAARPIVFPGRETVRAVQLADYEQLPPKARCDPMGPPPANLSILCSCIHCGKNAHEFEAIEMRWMPNEHMWACPCTTCGGRGFQFDIHPVEPVWECAQCKRWYKPEKFTSKYAKCPYCGSTFANGWYNDEDENGEPITEDSTTDPLPSHASDPPSRATPPTSDAPPHHLTSITGEELAFEEMPWNQNDLPGFARGEHHASQSPEAPDAAQIGPIPDDIDFPRAGIPEPQEWLDADEDNIESDNGPDGTL